jgi:hypothetical protein
MSATTISREDLAAASSKIGFTVTDYERDFKLGLTAKDDQIIVNAAGTKADPILLVEGDNTGISPTTGTDKYCYFSFTAGSAGTATIVCERAEWRAEYYVNGEKKNTNTHNPKYDGNTITLDLPNATGATENWIGVEVLGGNVVFDAADGGITTSANSDLFCSYVRNGATLTINDGTYIGGGSCVQVREGTLIVNGGYFEVSNPEADYRYVLNCTDANYQNGTAKIIVQGGSFLNWNPASNHAESGAGDTNFVPAGYTVVEEAVANGTLYTVVPA